MADFVTEMRDAIGHPVVENDYVTAVWANGNVALFKVIGLVPQNSFFKKKRMREDTLLLKRMFRDDVSETTQYKTVSKETTQCTWVDSNYVMLHKLEF